jgi:hypothetical protein
MPVHVLVRAEPQAEVACVPIVGAVKRINVNGSLNKYVLDCTCAGDIPTKLTVLCLDRRTGFRPTAPTDTPSGTNTSWTSTSLVAPTRLSSPAEGSSEAGTQAIIHTPANVAVHP